MHSVPVAVRAIMVLGPALLGLVLLFRFAPRLLKIMNRSAERRRPGEMADYAADTIISVVLIILALLGFFLLKPPYVASGTIAWGSHSGYLLSQSDLLSLSRTDASPGNVVYNFQIVSKEKVKQGQEFPLVRESISTHGKGGVFELGKDYSPDVAGEDLVEGNEGIFADEIKLVFNAKCAGSYTYDFVNNMITCAQPAPKTSWLDFIAPSAHADVLSILPGVFLGQTVHGKYQKLVDDVTQWDVDVITSERSSPGAKVAAMRKILTLNKSQISKLGEMSVRNSNSTLPLDLLDLQRHTDPEVAACARKLGDKMDVPRVLENMLAAWSVNPDKLLERIVVLPPQYREKILTVSADTLKEVGFTKQAVRLLKVIKNTKDIPQQALVPTGTPAGDRYYINVSWNKSDEKTTSCLAKAFEKSMNLWDYSYEKDFVKKNSSRNVYWYDRVSVLNAAQACSQCGAQVEYIKGYKTEK